MVQSPDEAHFRMIAKRILDGAVVPFLGAGVNLCGRPPSVGWAQGQYLPSGIQLAEHLADHFGFADTKHRTNLLRVSEYIDVMLGSGPLYEELHDVFDDDYPPTPVHRLLAKLPGMIRERNSDGTRYFPLIVTTNYDDSLERAFREAREPYDLVVYIADDAQDRGLFRHSSPDGQSRVISAPNRYRGLEFREHPVIAKIHGAVRRRAQERDSFVITENHYIDYLRQADTSRLIPVNMLSRMRNSHFLFLGYSLKDWNLRVILNRLRDAGITWRSWAVQQEPDGIEERFWFRRSIDLLDAELETYVHGLDAALLEAAIEERPVR
jgi:hypothetical protein